MTQLREMTGIVANLILFAIMMGLAVSAFGGLKSIKAYGEWLKNLALRLVRRLWISFWQIFWQVVKLPFRLLGQKIWPKKKGKKKKRK